MDLIAALGYDFFRNAILAGILASIACGIIGSFVVVKKMVSISGGISHASFGGIGLGYFLGFNPIAGAMLFSVAVAAIISRLRRVSHQHIDTLVGAVWAGGMALGILFVYLTPGFAPDLLGYLFGNILLVPSSEIIFMALFTLGVIIIVGLFYNQFLAVTFDEEYATVMNIPSGKFMALLLILTAATIVMLIQVVGIILVIALLTLPAAIAREFSGNLMRMFYLSGLIGICFTTGGIILSYEMNIPSGAAIIILSSFVYLCVIGLKNLK
ncbi:MAG: metal ABC transporter permease [Methanomicrobium sp.]|nr:metal ABC transporter permease [Methanomicrobium sp.]